MRYRNNEMIIDASSYLEALPDALMAFFYTSESEHPEVEAMRTAREAFVQQYALDDDHAPPLVRLDVTNVVEQGAEFVRGRAPWSLVQEQ